MAVRKDIERGARTSALRFLDLIAVLQKFDPHRTPPPYSKLVGIACRTHDFIVESGSLEIKDADKTGGCVEGEDTQEDNNDHKLNEGEAMVVGRPFLHIC